MNVADGAGDPIRYSKELARRWGRPTAPCEICGGNRLPRVRDHCHAHGWVRGVVCNFCNGLLSALDRGARPADRAVLAPLDAYVDLWLRCPDCRAVGWSETDHAVEPTHLDHKWSTQADRTSTDVAGRMSSLALRGEPPRICTLVLAVGNSPQPG